MNYNGDQAQEDNTPDIAKYIYAHTIQCPKFYDLGLLCDQETHETASSVGVDNLVQEVLLKITMHGMKILYGHNDIALLSIENIDTIKSYVRSYGFELVTESGIYFTVLK